MNDYTTGEETYDQFASWGFTEKYDKASWVDGYDAGLYAAVMVAFNVGAPFDVRTALYKAWEHSRGGTQLTDEQWEDLRKREVDGTDGKA